MSAAPARAWPQAIAATLAQPCARQRSNRRMYSRCTQALMRFRRRSAVTWPQKVIQKAHSVWRCSSSGSASISSASRSGRAAAPRRAAEALVDAPQDQPQRRNDDVLLALEVVRQHAGGVAGLARDAHHARLVEAVGSPRPGRPPGRSRRGVGRDRRSWAWAYAPGFRRRAPRSPRRGSRPTSADARAPPVVLEVDRAAGSR